MIPREKPEANLSFSFCLTGSLVALESPAGILFLDGPLPRALRTLAEELVVPSELLKQEKQRRKGDKNRKERKLVCSQTSIFSFELKTAHRDLDFSVKRRDQGGEEAASKKKYLFLFSLFAVTGFHALRVEKKEREMKLSSPKARFAIFMRFCVQNPSQPTPYRFLVAYRQVSRKKDGCLQLSRDNFLSNPRDAPRKNHSCSVG